MKHWYIIIVQGYEHEMSYEKVFPFYCSILYIIIKAVCFTNILIILLLCFELTPY